MEGISKMGIKKIIQEQFSGIGKILPILFAITFFLSTSIGLHEIGSRFLGADFFWRNILSLRLPSCLSHSTGVAIGFAFCIIFNKRIRSCAPSSTPWIMLSLLEAASVIGVYASLESPFDFAILLSCSQMLSGFTASIGVMLAAPFLCLLDHRQIIISTGLACILTAFTAWGGFSILELIVPLGIMAVLHVAFALAGGLTVFFYFRSSETSRHGVEETTVHELTLDTNLNVKGIKNFHPSALIWIIVCSYGFVFGILHAIPLGLTTYDARYASKIIGSLLAASLLYVSFSKSKIDTTVIWNRTYRFVFPLTVLSTLLLPFTQSGNFFPALACSECSGFYFDTVLFIACCVICKALRVNAVQFFAHVFFARSLGYLIGDIAGVIAYSVMLLHVVNIIGIIVFVLLSAITFNFNAEKYAKTAWGILPKEEPQGHFNRELREKCLAISENYRLTSRERDVLLLLAKNKRPKEISKELVVSIATVRTHIQGIYNKLDVHSHDALMELFRHNS